MKRIKKGDEVIVIAGKDKGRRGEIVRVAGERVFVSNINMIKRHTKPNPSAGQAGGIIEREASIHASNVMPLNPATGRGERVRIKTTETDSKTRRIRTFASNGEVVGS